MKKEIKLIKELIKYLEKNCQADKCNGYAPDCPNCRMQILIGLLEDELSILEYCK